MTRHNWEGKVIHWEICKKFKFDRTNKWYMHNPAAILENDTHKLLGDYDIQTDYQSSARRPDLQKQSGFMFWTTFFVVRVLTSYIRVKTHPFKGSILKHIDKAFLMADHFSYGVK